MGPLDLTSQAILDVVAESMRDGSVSVFDRTLRYLYASGPGLARVGLTRELLLGRTLYDLYPSAEVAMVAPHYQRAFSGENVRFDLPVFNRIYEIAASPLTEDTILVLVQDVTQTRTADAEHEQQNRFVAVVAHELGQPLAPLRVAVQLLKREPEQPAQSLAMIERELGYLERLVGDLGDAAQLGAGHFNLRMEDVDLAEIVNSAVQDATEEFGRLFVWEHTESVIVEGDRERLHKVFMNLLSNAARHTRPTDAIEVHLQRTRHAAVVSVRDSGTGIESDLLPRLFDPFVQGSGVKGRMGIGLHVVRAVVEGHRGTVEAFSAGRGRGSRFTVTLPSRT